MLKQSLSIALISFIIFSHAPFALAIAIEQVPNPRKINGTWVSDTAGLLTTEDKAQLDRLISALETKNGSEIAVVTVPDTAPEKSPKDYATKLFNYWKIGKQNQNNGVLFLVSQSDRRVEITTGTGLTTILPDSKVNALIQESITPQFKSGNFPTGIRQGTQALVVALSSPTSASNTSANFLETEPWATIAANGKLIYLVIFGIGFIRLYLWDSFRSRASRSSNSGGRGYDSSSSGDNSPNSIDSSSSSDFGGGDSSGGGSGDSW